MTGCLWATTGCEAILVQYIAFTLTYCGQIAEMATRHRLPSVYEVREYVDAGGLISGATLSDAVVAAAETHYGHAGRAFLEKLTGRLTMMRSKSSSSVVPTVR